MDQPTDKSQLQAFVIVNGTDIYPLDKDIVNIGRMEDNDIVLRSAHVSRYHVQIRHEEGVHRLVDLKSTSGTSVNGQQVTEKPLSPGDVISMAGVPMIYGRTSEPEKLGGFKTGESVNPDTVRRNLAATDAVDIDAIDRYLELFEPPENPVRD